MVKPKATEPKQSKPKQNKPKPKKRKKPTKPKKIWVWVGPGTDLSKLSLSLPKPSEPKQTGTVPKQNMTEPSSSTMNKASSSKPKTSQPAQKKPTTNNEVYEFKIALQYIKPEIWRLIQIPSHWNFQSFNEAIQGAMGWMGHHSWRFEAFKKQNNKLENIYPSYMMLDDGTFANTAIVKDYFSKVQDKAFYEYDMGDSWGHVVTLMKIVPEEKKKKYPICLDGKRACPPEDCGGFDGYEHILKVMKDPKHPEYDHYKSWLKDIGHKFKPEQFNPKTAYKNWKSAMTWGPA